jgi:hypothetical protein
MPGIERAAIEVEMTRLARSRSPTACAPATNLMVARPSPNWSRLK